MKNIHTILTGLLLLAVLYLLVDKFTGEKSTTQTATEQKLDVNNAEAVLRVAYVQVDSLNENYQYIVDQQAYIDKERTAIQNGIEDRTKKMQNRYAELQEKFANMTQIQAEKESFAAQEELLKLEENIKRYENDQANRLQDIQYDFQKKLQADLDSFLLPYKERYDFIFSYGGGASMLHANEGYDISDTLIQQMNDYYNASIAE